MSSAENKAPALRGQWSGRVFNSTSALMGSQVGIAFLRFASNLIIANHFLSPEDFGVVLIINAVLVVGELVTDIGFYPFVIRHEKGTDPKTLDVLFTLQVVRGVLLTLGVVALAVPLGLAFDKALVIAPLQLASLLFLAKGFHSFGVPLTRRAQREWLNSAIEFGIGFARIVVTILFAWQLRTYWALVYGILFGAVLELIASYLFYEKPWRKLSWNKDIFVEIWTFSSYILASGLITAVVMQFDRFYVVAKVPLEVAGVYGLMIGLVGIVDKFAIAYFNRIYFAKTSKAVRRDGPTAAGFYTPMAFMRPIFLFGCAAGAVAAPMIVEILFDERYQLGGTFLQILFLKPLFNSLAFPAQSYLISMKRMRAKFNGDVIRLVWLVIAVPVGFAQFGMIGLLWAVALQDFARGLYYYALLGREGVLTVRNEVPAIGAIVAGGVAGAIGSVACGAILTVFTAPIAG